MSFVSDLKDEHEDNVLNGGWYFVFPLGILFIIDLVINFIEDIFN